MRFSLIICTYMRPGPVVKLLDSVRLQQQPPHEVLVIDGSTDQQTKKALEAYPLETLRYYQVDAKDRGLTRQRNYGVARVDDTSQIVCFLDDDIVLTPDYFSALIDTYRLHPQAIGVGGYIITDTPWRPLAEGAQPSRDQFAYDGWVRPDGSRFVLRKRTGPGCRSATGALAGFFTWSKRELLTTQRKDLSGGTIYGWGIVLSPAGFTKTPVFTLFRGLWSV